MTDADFGLLREVRGRCPECDPEHKQICGGGPSQNRPTRLQVGLTGLPRYTVAGLSPHMVGRIGSSSGADLHGNSNGQ